MALPIALLAASTALTAYGSYMQGKEQEKASLLEAQDAQLRSLETMRRTEINNEMRTKQGMKLIGQQQVGYAASGVDVTQGAPMSTLMGTINSIMEENLKDLREADFSIFQNNKSAENSIATASASRTAGLLGVAGAGMSGGREYYKGTR